MTIYNLESFHSIYKNIKNNDISKEIINIVNTFNSELNVESNKNSKKKEIFSKEVEWNLLRNFNKTKIKKAETEIDINLHNIRKLLNMLTSKNLDEYKINIINIINSMNHDNRDEFYNFCNNIYNLLSNNVLYSSIYSDLYTYLIELNDVFKTILIKDLNSYKNLFVNLNYCDPDTDYDKFCQYNKLNDNRRGLCTFYVNLFKKDVISFDNITNIILYVLELQDNYINLSDESNKKNELDELSEISYIFISNLYQLIEKTDSKISKNIYEKIYYYSNLKAKDYKNISNKFIFKNMDILDSIS